MKEFFQVLGTDSVLALRPHFHVAGSEEVDLDASLGRILAIDIKAPHDIPGFHRATMDGYAVQSASTYGASESNPAYLEVKGAVIMGKAPDFSLGPGQAAHIATGGMLPDGADSVVMVEHTDSVDETTIEVHRSVAPGQNSVAGDEDAYQGQVLLTKGRRIRFQEVGLLAACGINRVSVYCRPRVGIVSTGDEIVPLDTVPNPGQVRDVNTHTLAALVREAGAKPVVYGIVGDRYEDLKLMCQRAVEETDMVLASGGSSVGMRDLTLDVIKSLPKSSILVHGISIRPGKPTILAQCGDKAFWGLPGHVTSAMVVFMVVVSPFLAYISGEERQPQIKIKARLSRNLASVQGRVDFVRVRLIDRNGKQWAEPILGQSGLIRTMVAARGLVAVDENSEGVDQGTMVDVIMI